MSDLVEKWNAFCEWQQRPYQVAQKSEKLERPLLYITYKTKALLGLVACT